jgi:hypothetical protein
MCRLTARAKVAGTPVLKRATSAILRKEKGTVMKKIVINKSYGSFCISHQAFLRLRELGQQDALAEVDLGAYWPEAAMPNEPSFNQCGKLIPRDDLKLAQVVEELGRAANGHSAELRVVSIPDDARWEISVGGGMEHISEVHRIWA